MDSDARVLQANLGVCMRPGNSASAKSKVRALDIATQPNSVVHHRRGNSGRPDPAESSPADVARPRWIVRGGRREKLLARGLGLPLGRFNRSSSKRCEQ